MDGATALGIVQVLASVLPANALQSSAIEQCHDIMAFVTHFMDVNVTLQPLGRRSECELEIRSNMMNSMHLQAVLKRVGVQWSRQGLGQGFSDSRTTVLNNNHGCIFPFVLLVVGSSLSLLSNQKESSFGLQSNQVPEETSQTLR